MPNWMFRSQIDVLDPFKIFSKYTPLNYNVTEKRTCEYHFKEHGTLEFNKHVLADACAIFSMIIEYSVWQNRNYNL